VKRNLELGLRIMASWEAATRLFLPDRSKANKSHSQLVRWLPTTQLELRRHKEDMLNAFARAPQALVDMGVSRANKIVLQLASARLTRPS
jgi:hypothetical protein